MTDVKHWSVDFNFCKLAKKAGFKIFVDPDAAIDHIGDQEVVNIQTFFKHNKKVFDKLKK